MSYTIHLSTGVSVDSGRQFWTGPEGVELPAPLVSIFDELSDERAPAAEVAGSGSEAHRDHYERCCALETTLISMDSTYSPQTRASAAEALETMLVERQYLRSFVEHVLFSAPVRPPGDLASTIQMADLLGLPLIKQVMIRLDEHSRVIAMVAEAWDTMRNDLFDEDWHRDFICRHLTTRGTFLSLAVGLNHGTPVDAVAFELLSDPVLSSIPHIREISVEFLQRFGHTELRQHEAREAELLRDYGSDRQLSSRQVFLAVGRQRDEIRRLLLNARDVDRAREFIADLVAFQEQHSDGELLAKSLCDLAQAAKEGLYWDLALELTERAVAVAPIDSWAWAQYASALDHAGRYEEAVAAFETCGALGGGSIAHTGAGHAYRVAGELEWAYLKYETARKIDPEGIHALLGMSETLRSMGELPAALALLEGAPVSLAFHPYVIQTRVRLLSLLGRDIEAREAMRDVDVRDLDAVGLAQYVRVLLRAGEVEEADRVQSHYRVSADPVSSAVAEADLAIDFGEPSRAASLLRGVVGTGASAPFVWRRLVTAQVLARRPGDALDTARRGLTFFPHDVALKGSLVDALTAGGDSESAIVIARELVRDHPSHAAGWHSLLKAVAQRHGPRRALRELESDAARALLGHPTLMKLAGDLSMRAADFDRAFESYSALLDKRPGEAQLISRLERARMRTGDVRTAVDNLESYRAEHPRDFVTGIVLAKGYELQSRFDESLLLYQELRLQRPYSSEALRGWVSAARSASGPVVDDDFWSTLGEGLTIHLRALRKIADGEFQGAVDLVRQAQRSSVGQVDAATRAAFAVCLLMLGDVDESLQIAHELGSSVEIPAIAELVRAHVYGAAGLATQSRAVLAAIGAATDADLSELRASITALLANSEFGGPSDTAILEKELRLLIEY